MQYSPLQQVYKTQLKLSTGLCKNQFLSNEHNLPTKQTISHQINDIINRQSIHLEALPEIPSGKVTTETVVKVLETGCRLPALAGAISATTAAGNEDVTFTEPPLDQPAAVASSETSSAFPDGDDTIGEVPRTESGAGRRGPGTGMARTAGRPRDEETLSEAWRGGGIMTGESELPSGERSETGGEEEMAGTDWERSGGGALGVTKPTCRTLGSMTAREVRRESMGGGVAWGLSEFNRGAAGGHGRGKGRS